MASLSSKSVLHYSCRNNVYPRDTTVMRTPVPDEKVSWDVDWPDYSPVSYEHPKLARSTYADKDIRTDKSVAYNFNSIDGKVDRTSFLGIYAVTADGFPLNPRGRTGLCGRGALAYWGPNHAGDPVVTRWKRDRDGSKVICSRTKKPVLQFVSIQRKDCKQWAFPGGMVDCGEAISSTVKREFAEEAMDSTTQTPEEKEMLKELLDSLFTNGFQLDAGYVDDGRNTDNAWIETVAMHFHDSTGETLGRLDLVSGDDAQAVRWLDASSELPLCTSDRHFLRLAVERLDASW